MSDTSTDRPEPDEDGPETHYPQHGEEAGEAAGSQDKGGGSEGSGDTHFPQQGEQAGGA